MSLLPTPRVLTRLPRLRALLAGVGLAAAGALAGCAPPAAGGPAPAPTIATGEQLLGAMRARYEGKWYRTLTFEQRTVQVPPQGGAPTRGYWYEAIAIPGRLRIELDSARRSGQIFANDSQYVIVNGQLRRAAAGHNVMQLLGFDVYAQPAARTAELLRGMGFPLTPLREGTWQERPVWIMGGRGPDDLRSHQIWIDRERLVFVRLLQPWPGDTSRTYEVRFNRYRPLEGGWIAPEVEVFVGRTRILFEEYENVRANVPLPDALFDPRRWRS
jgi:hypothetical protein